jgi:NADH-quinone oxidoreductase subunit N
MTVAMLALAGIPGTVGFIGKFQLIHALVAGSYTWLAIVLVIGSMISLGYYLRVVAAMWMRPALPFPGAAPGAVAGGALARGALAGMGGALPPMAGGSQEADADPETSGQGDDAPEVFSAAQVGGADGPAQDGPRAAFQPEVVFVAGLFAAAAVFFGIFPSPLFNFAAHAGTALVGLF